MRLRFEIDKHDGGGLAGKGVAARRHCGHGGGVSIVCLAWAAWAAWAAWLGAVFLGFSCLWSIAPALL